LIIFWRCVIFVNTIHNLKLRKYTLVNSYKLRTSKFYNIFKVHLLANVNVNLLLLQMSAHKRYCKQQVTQEN
jgi:hypothetical protein